MKRLIVISLTMIIIISLLLSGCKDPGKPGAREIQRPPVAGVTTVEVRPVLINEYYETSGTVKAKTVSAVASKVMGTVTSLLVKEGDRVSAGQVLLTIDDTDIAQKVMAAEAGHKEALKALEVARQNRALADITYQRYKQLYDEKAISRQEIDQIETQKRTAEIEYERVQEMVNRTKAGLSEAQVIYGFTQITAPTSGVITAKKIEIGSMAVPGVPLVVVEDDSSFTLDAYVDESLSGRLTIGMPADILIDALGKQVKGTIVEIAPSIDPMSRTFHIKVEFEDEGLKTGMYAKLKIPTGKKEAILLPETAIVEKGQLTGVYTVDANGLIAYRIIRVGRHYDHHVEIVSGLNPNEKVIVGGVDRAVDGGVVKEVASQ